MTYPGNPSLGEEVRERIVTTFVQSIELAEGGRTQEALLGCDFILELDPKFSPAETLKQRLSQGAAAGGFDDLRAIAMGKSPEEMSRQQSADDLFDLEDFELPDFEALEAPPAAQPAQPPASTPPAGAAAPAAPSGDLKAELERLMKARSYQQLLDLAGRQREAVLADPGLRAMAEAAQSRLEAQPYVESFLQEVGAAIGKGDTESARVALDKARSLDPSHPQLPSLTNKLEAALSAGAAADDAAFDLGGAVAPGSDDEDLFSAFDLSDSSDAPSTQVIPPSDMAPQAPVQPPPARPAAPPVAPVTPPSAAPAAAPGPDLASLSPGAPGEGDDRIAQLLDEGQQAADGGDYQAAIDAWSRIFLIDVDHAEAARRIEEARRLKAERERKVEEIFHDGLDALERGETDNAKERFEQVLEVQPNHLAAREYLQQIESGGPVTGPGPSLDETAGVRAIGSFDLSNLSGESDAGAPLQQEILVPPSPEEARASAAAAARRPAKEAAPTGRRSFVLIGGAVLVLVLVAGWFVWQNKDRFFPNSTAEEAGPVAEAPSAIARARDLHANGSTAIALGQLKRIRPDDPEYAEAQELIAEWEVPIEPDPADREPAISAEDLARREGLLARADQAFERSEYLRALELYDDARDISPLETDSMERFRQAAEELKPLTSQIELFHQGEYEIIIPELWRLLEEDPTDRDVRRLLVDSYYNRGVRELQRGDADRAADEFQEALSLSPDDPGLRRHFLFAQSYRQHSKDLLYRIYVKYLPFR